MKNIKDITISIFAVIGFVGVITAFTNQPQQSNQPTVPESHVWEMMAVQNQTTQSPVFLYNKVTGEVRKYSTDNVNISAKRRQTESVTQGTYITMKEVPVKEFED